MSMEKELFTPDYLHIPYEVFSAEGITPMDATVYAIIYWYEHMKDGRCYASNETIAKIARTTAQTVQNSLARLENKGFIKRLYKDSTKRVRTEIKALIKMARVSSGDDRVSSGDYTHVSSGDDQSINNISINNIIPENEFSDSESIEKDESEMTQREIRQAHARKSGAIPQPLINKCVELFLTEYQETTYNMPVKPTRPQGNAAISAFFKRTNTQKLTDTEKYEHWEEHVKEIFSNGGKYGDPDEARTVTIQTITTANAIQSTESVKV